MTSFDDVRIVPMNPGERFPTAGVEIDFTEAKLRQQMGLNTIWVSGEFSGSNTCADLYSRGMLPFPRNEVVGKKHRVLYFRPASLAEMIAAKSKLQGFWVALGKGTGSLEIPLIESLVGYQQIAKAEQACNPTFSDADWAVNADAAGQFVEAWLMGRLTHLFAAYQEVALSVKMMSCVITSDMLCGGNLSKASMFLKVGIQMGVEPVLVGKHEKDALA